MKLFSYISGSILVFVLVTLLVVMMLTSCGSPPSSPAPAEPAPDQISPPPGVGSGGRAPVRGPRVGPTKPSRPAELQPTPVQGGELATVADVKAYTTRGVITELPDGKGKKFFNVHHEHIESFQDRNGAVVGMKEMIMPFPDLAIPLDGYSVGQKVELTFEVRWDVPPRTLVTKLTPLAGDTVLNLSPEAK
jgi:hypothetical protein